MDHRQDTPDLPPGENPEAWPYFPRFRITSGNAVVLLRVNINRWNMQQRKAEYRNSNKGENMTNTITDRTRNAHRLWGASGYNGAAPAENIRRYTAENEALLEEYVTSRMSDEEYQRRRKEIKQP